MFLPDDKVLGPCPRHCGGVVITFGPTIRAARQDNGIDTSQDQKPRCDSCDYQAEDRAGYIRALREWRDAVMGAMTP